MKHIKIICAIAAAALLTGCADEAVSSATTQTTAQTTTTAETTIQTTSVVGSTAWESSSADLNLVDDSKPITSEDVSNSKDQIKDDRDKYYEQQEQAKEDAGEPTPDNYNNPDKPADSNDGNASQSSSNKTPDGKYDLADTDLVNTDGTYTQNLVDGECEVPKFVTEGFASWTAESAAKRGGQSNPSRIPYSEITLENAHEAFPYLGFVGYTPDYIEILPTDSKEVIEEKVWNNLVGKDVTNWGSHDWENWPSHYFKTEAEYNNYLAEQKAQREAQDRAEQQAYEDIANGDYSFSETGEELSNLLDEIDAIRG